MRDELAAATRERLAVESELHRARQQIEIEISRRQAASEGEITISAQMQAVVERLDAKLTEQIEQRKSDEGELARLRRQLQEQQ